MRDRPALQALLEVQEYFRLPHPALVEKDWLVVRALTAIAAVPCAPFRLVFGGGTALARAHRLISRMSEDIDLKIVGVEQPGRPALRALRQAVSEALLEAASHSIPTTGTIAIRETRPVIRSGTCPMRRPPAARARCGRR